MNQKNSNERRPPDLCPGWYRKMLDEKTKTLPVNWDNDTGVMSRDVIEQLIQKTIPEITLEELEEL